MWQQWLWRRTSNLPTITTLLGAECFSQCDGWWIGAIGRPVQGGSVGSGSGWGRVQDTAVGEHLWWHYSDVHLIPKACSRKLGCTGKDLPNQDLEYRSNIDKGVCICCRFPQELYTWVMAGEVLTRGPWPHMNPEQIQAVQECKYEILWW